MSLKVSLSDEMLVAALAPERTLPSMRAHVSLEVACLRKLFEALYERTEEELHLVLWPLHLLDRALTQFFIACKFADGGLRDTRGRLGFFVLAVLNL